MKSVRILPVLMSLMLLTGCTVPSGDELLAAPSTSPKNYWANTSGNGLILRLLDYELVEDWFQEVTRSNTERINRFCMAFPAGDVETQRGNRRGLQ